MAVKASDQITMTDVTDIDSTCRYYLLQSSTLSAPSKPTTNPPSSSWTKTEPSYTAGSTNSLYFTDLTVYSNGEFAYSDVSLSSSYEAAKVAYNKAVTAQTTANNSAKTATNYIDYDSTNGLQVGNKTSGSWSGFRTQITSSAFNVLNAAGETLASYGAKLIELGKNATDAVISLCGGKGKMSVKTDVTDFEGGTGDVLAITSDRMSLDAENKHKATNSLGSYCEKDIKTTSTTMSGRSDAYVYTQTKLTDAGVSNYEVGIGVTGICQGNTANYHGVGQFYMSGANGRAKIRGEVNDDIELIGQKGIVLSTPSGNINLNGEEIGYNENGEFSHRAAGADTWLPFSRNVPTGFELLNIYNTTGIITYVADKEGIYFASNGYDPGSNTFSLDTDNNTATFLGRYYTYYSGSKTGYQAAWYAKVGDVISFAFGTAGYGQALSRVIFTPKDTNAGDESISYNYSNGSAVTLCNETTDTLPYNAYLSIVTVSGTYEGATFAVNGLQSGKEYTLEFDFHTTIADYSTTTHKWSACVTATKHTAYKAADYNLYDSADDHVVDLNRDNVQKHFTLKFTATAETMYLVFFLSQAAESKYGIIFVENVKTYLTN